jgi:uncharacterized protein (DUF305 family)
MRRTFRPPQAASGTDTESVNEHSRIFHTVLQHHMRPLQFAIASVICVAFTSVAQELEQHEHAAGNPRSQYSSDTSFQAAMVEAMRRMDKGMAIAHSGSPDRDFAAMMIPHHQGAIDMAKAELQFGHDPVLRRLAQAIIVEQQQEIEVMRRQLDRMPASQAVGRPWAESLPRHDSHTE